MPSPAAGKTALRILFVIATLLNSEPVGTGALRPEILRHFLVASGSESDFKNLKVKMSGKQTFTVMLEKHEKMEATGVTIPFDVEEVFGAKRVAVKAEVNGAFYRGTVVRMGGNIC